jgi:hypothetical protein
VAPGGGSTPPTTTFPISPPAWQPTTVIARLARLGCVLRNRDPAEMPNDVRLQLRDREHRKIGELGRQQLAHGLP